VSRYAVAALLWLLAAGCTSTMRVSSAWTDSSASGPDIGTILVVATAEDLQARRTLEGEVAGRLRGAGMATVEAHPLLPSGEPADAAARDALAARLGADARLVVRLRIDTQVQQSPDRVRVAPAVTYWGSPRALGRPPFASYSRATTRRIDVASLQAILEKGADDAIVWSASTEAFAPRDLARVARNVATLLLDALKERHLIAQAPLARSIGPPPQRAILATRPRETEAKRGTSMLATHGEASPSAVKPVA
jgi:hypothetical protein